MRKEFVVNSFLRVSIAAASIVLAAFGSQLSFAAPVQFAISGTVHVNDHQGPLPEGIFEGAPWTGMLSYDTEIPDTWTDPADEHRGFYVSERISLRIDIGPTYFIPEPDTSFLLIGDNIDWPPGQLPPTPKFVWHGDSIVFQTAEFDTSFQYVLGGIDLTWVDPTGTALSSDALPSLLSPGMFEMPAISISHGSIDRRLDNFSITASVERIDLIPEPSALTTLFVAVGVLVCLWLLSFRRTTVSRRPK